MRETYQRDERADSVRDPHPSSPFDGAIRPARRAITDKELLMLRAVMATLRRRRAAYCRAIGEENVAALIIRLYQQGITDERNLREVLGVGDGEPRRRGGPPAAT